MTSNKAVSVSTAFLVFIGLVSGAGGCAKLTPVPSPTPAETPSQDPTLLSPAPLEAPPGPRVYFLPAALDLTPGEEFEVQVVINPLGYGISSGELKLRFYPEAAAAVSIEPGSLLGADTLVGLERINNQTGTIKYALARKGQTVVPTEPGTLAVITFVSKATGRRTCGIQLTKVGLADELFEQIPNVTNSSTTDAD